MKQAKLDADHLSQWIGSKQTTKETISVEPLHRMRATLDLEPKTMRGTLALGLLSETDPRFGAGSGWACCTGRFYATGTITASHVGRLPIKI